MYYSLACLRLLSGKKINIFAAHPSEFGITSGHPDFFSSMNATNLAFTWLLF
jgi:hypothetical protein